MDPGNLSQYSVTTILNNDFDSWVYDSIYGSSGNANFTKVASPAPRDSSYCLQATLDRTSDANTYRTEIIVEPSTVARSFGQLYQYEISTLIPLDWQEDHTGTPYTANGKDMLFQFHNVPDVGDDAVGSILAIRILGDYHYGTLIWDESDPTTNSPQTWDSITFYLGKINKGVWDDWVVRVNWAYDATGRLWIWKNGHLLFERSGPNCTNDAEAPYSKFGIYKIGWQNHPTIVGDENITTRALYYDRYKMLQLD